MQRLTTTILLAICAITTVAQPAFDVQGHRGARGLFPENSIPAFKAAIAYGVTTLEMDVVVTSDSQLVLSHEPWMDESICTLKGEELGAEAKTQHNIFKMPYSRVQQYDCGSRGNAKFPEQQHMATYKPLLTDVIDTAEYYSKLAGRTIFYNIETKCTPEGDNVYHPTPEVFAQLLYEVIIRKRLQKQVTIQSFDVRTLQAFHRMDTAITLAMLVFNAESLDANLRKLGFVPDIYSPNFALVTPGLIRKCHAKGMRIIPWTVNDKARMHKLKKMGVDGLITDYPDRAVGL